jgi:hypothetical protein
VRDIGIVSPTCCSTFVSNCVLGRFLIGMFVSWDATLNHHFGPPTRTKSTLHVVCSKTFCSKVFVFEFVSNKHYLKICHLSNFCLKKHDLKFLSQSKALNSIVILHTYSKVTSYEVM